MILWIISTFVKWKISWAHFLDSSFLTIMSSWHCELIIISETSPKSHQVHYFLDNLSYTPWNRNLPCLIVNDSWSNQFQYAINLSFLQGLEVYVNDVKQSNFMSTMTAQPMYYDTEKVTLTRNGNNTYMSVGFTNGQYHFYVIHDESQPWWFCIQYTALL